jgi:hypothetical protein
MPIYVPNDPFPTRLRRDGWGGLLRRWGTLLDQYERLAGIGKDVAYWHGERALTGILAAAAWQIQGGGSLEEFVGRRGPQSHPRPGRGDAWIVTGGVWYCIEAKQYSVYGTPRAAIRGTETRLRSAVRQLRDLSRDYKTDRALALCYVLPGVSWQGAEASNTKWREYSEALGDHFKADGTMVASYKSPGETSGRFRYEGDGVLYHCLGVILVGRQAW